MLFICQCRRHVFSRRYFRYSIYTVTARVVLILIGGIVVRDLERGLTLDIALYQDLFDYNFV